MLDESALGVTVVVRNTGSRAGREVVQAYVEPRYDEASGGWVRPPGEFTVRLGRSSADLRLSVRVRSG